MEYKSPKYTIAEDLAWMNDDECTIREAMMGPQSTRREGGVGPRKKSRKKLIT